MKWLNPKTHPIPKDKYIIIYRRDVNYVSCAEKLDCDDGNYYILPLVPADGDYYGDFEEIKIEEENIIAWMPLPSLPLKIER